FFVAVFRGNIAQYTGHVDAFGLDTDAKRAIRLVFQPLLVALALASTDAVRVLRGKRAKISRSGIDLIAGPAHPSGLGRCNWRVDVSAGRDCGSVEVAERSELRTVVDLLVELVQDQGRL